MLNTEIINWYELNKRDLPWRKTTDPYKIWISEIMLQQTQVITVVDYYDRFLKRFPKLEDLAKADEQDVLKLWQGLGYYSRARNLHEAAKTIVNYYEGVFPKSFTEIVKLKGIGVYTASAIAAFAFHLPYAAVDGNVYRVLARLFGVSESTTTPKGKKIFQKLADDLMAEAPPHLYNQAIIEFGALQCTAKNPKCESCPLQANCFAFEKGQQDLFPRKKNKVKITHRYFYYLYIYKGDQFLIQQRGDDDIWKNMYEFPLIETQSKMDLLNLFETEQWERLFKDVKIEITHQHEAKPHKLSHQNLYLEFLHIHVENLSEFSRLILTDREEVKAYPVPKPIAAYLAEE